MRLTLFTFTLLPLTASAQLFTFGVQGGVPSQVSIGQTSEMPFVLGPSVDIRAFAGLSLETGCFITASAGDTTTSPFSIRRTRSR